MKKFILQIKDEILEVIKNPKKLLPTFILAAIWLILPILTNFIPGINTPFIRFINTITYARAGIDMGLIGLIGGMFGKAVFAAVINGLVLTLCAKKNPFKGAIPKFIGTLKEGKRAVNPLMIGAGAGLILYLLFNVSVSTQNIAIAVVAFIATLEAISRQNGMAFALSFYIAKKVSKGKVPSRQSVSRILTGLAAGFGVALPITFIRSSLLILVLGFVLLVVGCINGKKAKKVAAMIAMLIWIPSAFSVLQAYELPEGFVDASNSGLDFGKVYSEEPQDDGYSNPASLDGVYLIPKNIITYSVDFVFPEEFAGRHIIGIGGEPITFNTDDIKILRKGNNGEYVISGGKSFTGSDKQKGGSYSLEYTYEFTISNIKMNKHSIIADYNGEEKIKYWSDDPEYPGNERVIKIKGKSDSDECRWHTTENGHEVELRTPGADFDDKKGLSMVFEIAGVVTNGKTAGVVGKPHKDNNRNSDFDKHDVATVVGAIITTVAGTVGGVIGSTAGATSGFALDNLNLEEEEEDLGKHIHRDSDGDLNVKDPITKKDTLYKSNGDGTYKNMTTGDSYTLEEIKEHVMHIENNADYYKDIKNVSDNAVAEQRKDAKEISNFAKKVDKKVKKDAAVRIEEEAHQEYKEKVANKYGTEDEKKIKKEILKNRNEEYKKQGENLAKADIAEGLEKSAKNIETTADVIVSVAAELDATKTGSIVKDAYTGAKAVLVNTTEAVIGQKSVSGAVASAITDASVGIAQNHSTSVAGKLLTNSSGDAIKTVADGYARGLSEEEIKANAKEAAKSGAINAAVDVGFDKASGKVIKKIKNKDEVIGKAFKKEITKESITKAGQSAANDITKNTINKKDGE